MPLYTPRSPVSSVAFIALPCLSTPPPHPPTHPPTHRAQELEADVEAVEKGVVKEARVIEEDLEKGLLSFGRGFTVLEQDISEELAAELKQAKRALEKVCGVLVRV